MNSNQFEGQWKQLKGKVKQQWGKLTDDDINVINGKRDVLIGKLQERYGYVQQEAQRKAEEWLKTMHEEPAYAHSGEPSHSGASNVPRSSEQHGKR